MFLLRTVVAECLGLPESSVRVRCPEVGGAFGLKLAAYPEDILCARATIKLGRPVKFVETRCEHLMGTVHARQQRHRASAAFAADGTTLAICDEMVSDHRRARPRARSEPGGALGNPDPRTLSIGVLLEWGTPSRPGLDSFNPAGSGRCREPRMQHRPVCAPKSSYGEKSNVPE
jgi:hypothetical protein